MTRGLEQKTRIGTSYPYERESVAFYSNHLRVPSSRYVRLVRFHDEWKSDGQCAPIVLQVSLPAAFYQSASGFTRGLCPLYFHADDSCRPAFVMHDTMHFYFHFATRRKPGSAFDDSLLQSDSIFAKRRRAEEPLRPKYIIPPFFFSQWKRRRDPWKGISSIFFSFFCLFLFPFFFVASNS